LLTILGHIPVRFGKFKKPFEVSFIASGQRLAPRATSFVGHPYASDAIAIIQIFGWLLQETGLFKPPDQRPDNLADLLVERSRVHAYKEAPIAPSPATLHPGADIDRCGMRMGWG